VSQEESEHNEVDGMKKAVDSVSATVFEIFALKDRQESCAIAKMTARCALYK